MRPAGRWTAFPSLAANIDLCQSPRNSHCFLERQSIFFEALHILESTEGRFKRQPINSQKIELCVSVGVCLGVEYVVKWRGNQPLFLSIERLDFTQPRELENQTDSVIGGLLLGNKNDVNSSSSGKSSLFHLYDSRKTDSYTLKMERTKPVFTRKKMRM